MIDFWQLLDCDNEQNYDEFCLVLEEKLTPRISEILVNGYQEYLKDKLGTEFDRATVKDMIKRFFEEYLLTSLL